MTDVIGALKAGGYSDEEIGSYMTGQRQTLRAGGYSDDEIDGYLGVPRTPKTIPMPLIQRAVAGTEAVKTLNELPDQGSGVTSWLQQMWERGQPKGALAKGVAETEQDALTSAFDVAKAAGRGFVIGSGDKPLGSWTGAPDWNAPGWQKLSQAGLTIVGSPLEGVLRLGGGVAGAATAGGMEVLKKLTGQDYYPESVAGFLNDYLPGLIGVHTELTRLERDHANTPQVKRVGGLPDGTDIQNASRAIGSGDTTPLMEKKLTALYAQQGMHPAEVVEDARRDPTIAQSILSSDAGDMPYGYQFHGWEALPEKVATMESVAERLRQGMQIFEPPEGKIIGYHGTAAEVDFGTKFDTGEGTNRSEHGVSFFATRPEAADVYTSTNARARARQDAATDTFVKYDLAKRQQYGTTDWRPKASVEERQEYNDLREQMSEAAKPPEGAPGPRMIPVQITPGKTETFDVSKLFAEDEEFHEALRKTSTDPDIGAAPPIYKEYTPERRQELFDERLEELRQRYKSHENTRARVLEETKDDPEGPRDIGPWQGPLDLIAPAVYLAKQHGLDTAKITNLAEHGEQVIVLNPKMVEPYFKLKEPTVSIREPYFQDPTRRGQPFKTDSPLNISQGETPMPDHGVPIAEGFELKQPSEKDNFREQLLLEGRDVNYSDAEKRILSKISVDEKSIKRPLTLTRLYTDFFDKLFPINKAVRESMLPLTPENNPYVLARLLNGYAGKADHFLNNGTFNFGTYQNSGPSLKAILEPVKEDLNKFREYAASSRAIELEGRGIKSGLGEDGLADARSILIEGQSKYEKPFRALVNYQNRVTEYLRDSGVLSRDAYSAMLEANKMYVPFSRVMGIDEKAPSRGGSSLLAHNPVNRIKGSAREIVDPLESIIRNTYHMIEMAERNQVGLKLIDVLRSAPKNLPSPFKAIENSRLERASAISDELGTIGIKDPDALAEALSHGMESTKERPGTISVMRDGKRETYKVDQELAIAMKGLDVDTAGAFARAFALPAETMRAGAVRTPEFWTRHIFRDFMYAFTTFKGGVFNPMDMARGFAGLWVKDTDYWNWLKGGGGNISSVGIDRRYLQEDLRKLTEETGLMGRAWNVLTDPEASMWAKAGTAGKLPFQAIGKFVLDPLRVGVELAENASHLGAFKKGMRRSERGEPEAVTMRDQIIRSAWVSRDTAVDAARMGANMRAYNMITAFANITLQDFDRTFRAIKDDPVNTLMKIGGGITLPSVILWANNHNDPRYQQVPQWEKDLFWLIMTPDHIIRVPKPWGMGLLFGTVPERLLDAFVTQKPNAFKDLPEQFIKQNLPGFIPTAFQPIIEQFASHSTFTNRTLIPSSQEQFLPEYQQTPYTTQLAQSLGRILGSFPGMSARIPGNEGFLTGPTRAVTSPILLENYIREWTGGLGDYALMATDTALRKMNILPDPPMPASRLEDIPFIRAFTVRYPDASAQSIQDFYSRYQASKSLLATWTAKVQEGDTKAAGNIQKMGGQEMFIKLDAITKALSTQQQIVRNIYKNPNMQPDQKRQLIDSAYYAMIKTAEYGNQVMDAVERRQQ